MNQRFSRFADWVAVQVAKAWFFVLCVLLVVTWAPSIAFIKNVDTWQLLINTATTIITFLLVALLHNTTERFESRTDKRLCEVLQHLGISDPVSVEDEPHAG